MSFFVFSLFPAGRPLAVATGRQDAMLPMLKVNTDDGVWSLRKLDNLAWPWIDRDNDQQR